MTLLKPEDLTRLEGVVGYTPSDDGHALVLFIDTAGGPINLEIPAATLRQVFTGLLQGSVACALRRHDLPSMADSDPAASVYMPASEVEVLPVKGAHRRLVIRTGVVDFSLMIENQEVANVLVAALQD